MTFIWSESAEAARRPGFDHMTRCNSSQQMLNKHLRGLSHGLSPTLLMPRAAFRALEHLSRCSFWTERLEDRGRTRLYYCKSRSSKLLLPFHSLRRRTSGGCYRFRDGADSFAWGHVHTPLMQNKLHQFTCMEYRKEAARE